MLIGDRTFRIGNRCFEWGLVLIGALWVTATAVLGWAVVIADGWDTVQAVALWLLSIAVCVTIARIAVRTQRMFMYAYNMGRTDEAKSLGRRRLQQHSRAS